MIEVQSVTMADGSTPAFEVDEAGKVLRIVERDGNDDVTVEDIQTIVDRWERKR